MCISLRELELMQIIGRLDSIFLDRYLSLLIFDKLNYLKPTQSTEENLNYQYYRLKNIVKNDCKGEILTYMNELLEIFEHRNF